MPDLDDAHRSILNDFAVYEMNSNPAGIGNECTHWIYAALFEARALDNDRTLGISQTGANYTWGRRVGPDQVLSGDIAQFDDFKNTFFLYQSTGSNFPILTSTQVRGPKHTGMVFIHPSNGVYYQMESHLHHTGIAHMTIRGNPIYYESFAIALSQTELEQIKKTPAWTASVDTNDIEDMLDRIDWASLRDQYSLELKQAQHLVKRLKINPSATITKPNGDDIACLLVVQAEGSLRFYRAQASPARLGMSDDQLAEEKANLIHMMIKSGRKGGSPTEDEYGGDNKKERVYEQRFDWSYPSPSPSLRPTLP